MGMDRRSWVLKNYADGPSGKKTRSKVSKLSSGGGAQKNPPLLVQKARSRFSYKRCSRFKVSLPRALGGLLDYQERLPSPLWVFIMAQCCKITGFPQCFLLFVRLCHGNLERLHVGDSGLSCKAPRSGIYDVSGSCAKAFLRLLSDSSSTRTSL